MSEFFFAALSDFSSSSKANFLLPSVFLFQFLGPVHLWNSCYETLQIIHKCVDWSARKKHDASQETKINHDVTPQFTLSHALLCPFTFARDRENSFAVWRRISSLNFVAVSSVQRKSLGICRNRVGFTFFNRFFLLRRQHLLISSTHILRHNSSDFLQQLWTELNNASRLKLK